MWGVSGGEVSIINYDKYVIVSIYKDNGFGLLTVHTKLFKELTFQ